VVSASVDVLAAQLESLGPWPPGVDPIHGRPVAAGLSLSDDGQVSTGIWECTSGSFASRREGICELMHFVSGDATITDEDGTRHEIRPGVMLFLPDGWCGVWEIRETVRKTYAIVKTSP
jgi:uncharacterized cupin superfamily protein